jgi:lysine-N-methylase
MQQAWFVKEFTCLGDACADTCCKGWGMQLSQQTVALYREKAPELLDAVTSGEAEHIMKRDPNTDYCVKFDAGWCGVQKTYGADFLGDACHFYPRATRSLGNEVVMSAALSCPEIVRLALFTERQGKMMDTVEIDRVPHSLKDYLPNGMDAASALTIHQAFLDAAEDAAATPEQIIMRIISVASSLEMLPQETWADAVGFYLRQADGRLPPAEAHPSDAFNILNILVALVNAAKVTHRPRLARTMEDMARALAVTVDTDRATLITSAESFPAWQRMCVTWNEQYAQAFAPTLLRWIAAQLSLNLMPFSGLGDTLTQRTQLLAMRFATVKLALMSLCHVTGAMPEQSEVIRVIQSLSRFCDHLADPTASLSFYAQAGWTTQARIRGML